jgi:hypothetical protein
MKQLLAPIFQRTGKGSSEGGLLDNAAAAVARIVMACPNSVPMAQVSHITAFTPVLVLMLLLVLVLVIALVL